MINPFSLSQKLENVLPTTVESGGRKISINADFRVILRVFRLLGDPDIAERHKVVMACGRFFACAPADIPPDGFALLMDFISRAEGQRDPGAPQMDFEFDADVIWASFLQQYGIDLLTVDFLHWYAFLVLLQGLGEDTPLSSRLFARGRDTSKLKGKDKRSAEIAKKNAQIPKRVGTQEQQMQRKLNEALMSGGDIRGIL